MWPLEGVRRMCIVLPRGLEGKAGHLYAFLKACVGMSGGDAQITPYICGIRETFQAREHSHFHPKFVS